MTHTYSEWCEWCGVRAPAGAEACSCGEELAVSRCCQCAACAERRRVEGVQAAQHEAGHRNAKSTREQMAIVLMFAALLWWLGEPSDPRAEYAAVNRALARARRRLERKRLLPAAYSPGSLESCAHNRDRARLSHEVHTLLMQRFRLRAKLRNAKKGLE